MHDKVVVVIVVLIAEVVVHLGNQLLGFIRQTGFGRWMTLLRLFRWIRTAASSFITHFQLLFPFL